MVGVRPPERLQTSALYAWLKALNAAVKRGEGVRAPLPAPPALLAAALNQGASGLREAVVARLAVAAVTSGISRLEVHLEHPTLIEALLETLDEHPSQITSLSLSFGPRATIGGLLCNALKGMPLLTSLTLTPVATDGHLAALSLASPPLQSLDISYSKGVTDKGVRALVGLSDDTRTMKELVAGSSKHQEGKAKNPGGTLNTVNLWGTDVTTRGCVTLLSACHGIVALTCQWAGEALDIVVRSGRENKLSLSQLLLAEAALPPLESVAAVCPNLSSLVARRPPHPVGVAEVMEKLPSITALTLLQFLPDSDVLLPRSPTEVTRQLTCLHLSVLEPRQVSLSILAQTFPSLTLLKLEGIIPTLPYPLPDVPASRIENLSLITPLTRNYVIVADVAVWAIVWASLAYSISLGSCTDLLDQHLSEAITRGALKQVEDLRISGAARVTDAAIEELVDSCPNLHRLAFKMLPKERLADLEALKVKFRQDNLDLELITYGWKF
ncbi:uncharacterized protein [Macrobrachium rosenbergii]|uniref:uncharacterized protein n=1 Tax=Macrobrachium rosenbergii TaxID=79674 RepID=UPI0034D6AF46